MSLNSSLHLTEVDQDRNSAELISMLKSIIAEQEDKILELETDLKKC